MIVLNILIFQCRKFRFSLDSSHKTYDKFIYFQIIVFEEEKVGKYVSFLDHPLLT